MLTRKLTRFAAACAVGAIAMWSSPVQAAEEGWTVDFGTAKKAAATDKKDIFMEFTGSDWCPPCKALKAQILDSELFGKEVHNYFVLLKIDNPRDKSKQTPEEIAQYQTLSKEFGITGVPTIILADPAGRPYAQMVGFGGGTPEQYMENLKKLQAVRVKRDEALGKAANASGVEKAKLLDEAIGGIDAELAAATYKEEIGQIIACDADNKAGLKAKYTSVLQLKEIKAKLREIQMSAGRDAAKVNEGIDKLMAESKPTGAALQEVLYTKAMVTYQTDREAAMKLLQQVIDTDPSSAKATQTKQIMERIKALPAPATPAQPAK